MLKKGKLISLEGVEGAGKTTLAKTIVTALNKAGIEVIYTREPGGTIIAEKIRQLCKEKDISNIAEFFLILAARAEHIEKVIIPNIDKGICVICDRYIDSSICYNGILQGLGLDYVVDLHNKATNSLWPDITLLLDLPVNLSIDRIKSRSVLDKYDQMDIDSHNRIRQGYLHISQMFSDRVKLIDATKRQDETLEDCMKVINKIL